MSRGQGVLIPIAIPKDMPEEQARALVDYLKSNPEAAKTAHDQAQAMLRHPGVAQSVINAAPSRQTPEAQSRSAEVFAALKDDPELAAVFQDMQENGPSAMAKYMEDKDLMLKVSAKLQSMNLGGPTPDAQSAAQSPAQAATDIFGAAKLGDVEACKRFLVDEGQSVNAQNDRGISPLGIAVGFNRVAVVELLLSFGADVMARDPKDNTTLHYAAGYGRMDVVKILIAAGAQLSAENSSKQTPLDVAALNKEAAMVDFLTGLATPAKGAQ
ncbi:MAG: hypothetical protein WDW38_009504 [Sanguina aurantia]